MSERLGVIFLTMIDRILKHANFRRYENSMKEDMRGHACLLIVKYIHNCDPDTRTPRQCFNYVTTTIWNAFVQVIKKHYQYENARHIMIRDAQLAFEQAVGIQIKNKDTFEL